MQPLSASYRFDPWTAVLTLIVAPVVFLIFRIIARYLKVWSAFATEGLLHGVSRLFMHGLSARISMRRYSRLMIAATKYVTVPSRNEIALEIDAMYVTLTLERHGGTQQSFSHADLLDAGNRLRIVGDPGSGKSSLIKRLLRDAAALGIESPTTCRFPILFELRNLDVPPDVAADGLGAWFYEYLRAQTAQVDVYRLRECFDAYAQSAGLLLLLDGLDEISMARYDRAQAAINQLAELLAQKSEHNVVVLTTRVQFHQQVKNAFAATFPVVLFLKPFTPTDIYEFLTRWPFAEDPRAKTNRIYSQLTDRPTVRELCGNPLVLSMYVAEAELNSEQVTPDSRTEFYTEVADELLVDRRLRQTRQPAARALLRQAREQVLGKLAFDHLLDAEQPANSLSWRAGVTAVSDLMNVTAGDAEDAFEGLSNETGLFTIERARESFRFIHLTFCEYFAAVYAVRYRPGGWRLLLDAHRRFQTEKSESYRTRLLEVLPFAAGLLNPVDRGAALDDLLDIGDLPLLARTFLETKNYHHPAWSHFVERQKEVLLARPEWNDEMLLRLHLFSVVVTDARIAKRHTGMASQPVDLDGFLRQIVERNPAELTTLLSAYAQRDAAAVFRLATIAEIDLPADFPQVIFRNCDQRPFFEMVKDAAVAETTRIHLWAAVFAEAALRSRLVARDMNAMPPWKTWQRAVAALPGRQCWFQPRILRRTFLTEALSLAVQNRHLNPALVLVREIQNVPPPGNYRAIASITFRLLVALAAACSLPLLAYWMKSPYLFWTLVAALPLFIIAATLFALPMRAVAQGFQLMLSLDDPETRVREPLELNFRDRACPEWLRPSSLRSAMGLFMAVKEVHGMSRGRTRSLSGRHISAP